MSDQPPPGAPTPPPETPQPPQPPPTAAPTPPPTPSPQAAYTPPPPVQVPGPAYAAAPQTTQPRRTGRTACIVVVIVLLCFGIFGAALFVMAAAFGGGGSSSAGLGGSFGEKVGVINVTGLITGGSGTSLFGGMAGSETLMKLIRKARKETSVKAVVLRINSPGGSAAASQEIYHEVLRLRDKKPVVISMGDVAASGGYYISSAGTKIMAAPATLTGSIGVIMSNIEYYEGLQKIGVKMDPVKSGVFNDIGSGARPMTPEERQLLKTMVMDVYDQFVTDIATARQMDPAEVRKIADGRILTGRQAKEVKLVDELGNYRDALVLAAKLGGIKGEEFQVHEFGKVTLFEALAGETGSISPDPLRRALEEARWRSATQLLLAPQLSGGMDLSLHAP